MRDALASQNMGTVVSAYRRHPIHGRRPLAQSLVAGWLGITQGQLSRIESGRNKVRDLDRLRAYAATLQIPPSLLWFDAEQTRRPARRARRATLPGGIPRPSSTAATDSSMTKALLTTLRQYSTADNMYGPGSMLPLAGAQMSFIESLLPTAVGAERFRLLYVGARFAEFTGWLNQDGGDLRAAMAWSDRALDMAREARNAAMVSYILMRKSHIALDAGLPDLVLTLAQAAAEVPGELTPRMRALAARQEAHAYAMFGDHDACTRALDRAFEMAAEPADDRDIARYCTPNYIEMEAAHAWAELGKPDMALDVLQSSLVAWEPDFRRDLGMGLARFAIAHARTGAPDDALDIALESIRIVGDTGSARTARQLFKASSILDRTGARGIGADLRHALQTTLRQRR
ncbi:helix-turn-helix domain-containing protein [Promicromonospora sp. Populi]|uniref:helix-turn-helix domain-containing protein n=1 Tax=Promicromonospora sp. Populi TaxID=3239420 RepID=UPI0034E2F2DF